MKKMVIFLIIFFLVCSLALANNQDDMGPKGIHEPGTGLEVPELMDNFQGSGQGLQQLEDDEMEEPEEEDESDEDEIKEPDSEPLPGFGSIIALFCLLAAIFLLGNRD